MGRRAGSARDRALFPAGVATAKKLLVLDGSTGEASELDGVFLAGEGNRTPYSLGSFKQISKKRTLAMVRKESGLSDADVAVFLYVALAATDTEDYGHYLVETTNEIADALGKSRATVGKIITKLAKHHIILPVRQVGRVCYYRASPHIIFQGSGEEQQVAASQAKRPTVPGHDGTTAPLEGENKKRLRAVEK